MQENNKRIIFCDFDGTITTQDSLVHILDEFADKNWREIELRVKKGEIGNRISLKEEFDSFRGSWDDITECIDKNISIDPHLKQFLKFCDNTSTDFIILSGGFQSIIKYILEKNSIQNITYYANILKIIENKATLTYPYPSDRCKICGHCKTSHLLKARDNGYKTIVYIGDGTTDRCPIKEADIVFAKGSLARYCEKSSIKFISWDTFLDIQSILEKIFV